MKDMWWHSVDFVVLLLLSGGLTSCCAAWDRVSGVLRQKPSSLRCVVSGMAL